MVSSDNRDIIILPDFNSDYETDSVIWRYMSLEKFYSLIDKSALYFSNASQLGDHFEGSLSEATRKNTIYEMLKHSNKIPEENFKHFLETIKSDYSPFETAFASLTTLTKINCWHMNPTESHLMWYVYSKQNKGVAIKSSLIRLKSALKDYRIQPNYGTEKIYLGKVKYIDFKKDVMTFDNLKRFFYKKQCFSLENEFRAVVSLRLASEFVPVPDGGILVPVNLNMLIESIYLSPQLNINSVYDKLKKHGYDFPLIISELEGTPVYFL